jgi:hypothetical protein
VATLSPLPLLILHPRFTFFFLLHLPHLNSSKPFLISGSLALLLRMIVRPQQCVILDFSDADLSDVDAFSAFEAEWILRTQEFGLWRRVIVAATNYPEKILPLRMARPEWAETNG